mgnify:CR=1 FL=1
MANFHKFPETEQQQPEIEATGMNLNYNAPVQEVQMGFQQQMYPQFGMNQEYYQPQQQPNMQQQQQLKHPLPAKVMQNHQNMNIGPMALETVVYDPQSLFKVSSRGTQLAICPSCQKYVQTLVDYQVGTGAILSGGLIAIVGGWLGCFLLPCVLQDCKDVVHYCPACGLELGKKKFIMN